MNNWTENTLKEAREYLEKEYNFKSGFPEEQFEQLRPILSLLANFLPKPFIHATAMGGLVTFIWSDGNRLERGLFLHFGCSGIWLNFDTHIQFEMFRLDNKTPMKIKHE
jgi:hypothetical protein